MPGARQTVTALHRLTRLPLDDRAELFARYPSLKLGVRESTVHYAKRLMPLAAALILSDPRPAHWVLTAPPYHAIPAAANLLCLEIFDLLQAGLPTALELSLIEIAERPHGCHGDQAPADYSRLNFRQRSESRQRTASALLDHPALFGRSVIFVNDINVTGAQQRVMRRYFERCGVRAVHWLYIIDVEESLGRRMPQIEYAINSSKLATFEEFVHVLAAEDLIFTSKCIARMFSYDDAQLTELLNALPARRRSMILELAVRDARYRGDHFKNKIDLLSALCSLDSDTPDPHGTLG
jgi:hypothetical protein